MKIIRMLSLVAVTAAVLPLQAHEWVIQDYIRDRASLTFEEFIEQCVTSEGYAPDETTKALAFDGVTYSPTADAFWHPWITSVKPALIVKIPSGVTAPTLIRYRLAGQYGTSYSYTYQIFPRDFALQGRNSDDEEWTDVDVQSGFKTSYNSSSSTYKDFDFQLATPVAYRQYRLRVDETQQNQHNHSVGIMELSLVVEDGVTTPNVVYCVTPEGTDDGAGTWASPISFKAALAKATPLDEIHVKEGTYDCANYDRHVATNACTIRGGYLGTEAANAAPAGTLRSTFDLGGKKTNGLEIVEALGRSGLIENLAFTNAYIRGLYTRGLNGRFKNCASIRNGWNVSLIAGRGAYVETSYGGRMVFEDCEFRNNLNQWQCNGGIQSNGGSGLYAFNVDLVLTNCLFVGNGQRADVNSATYARDCSPGAALLGHYSKVTAYNCGFFGNRGTLNSGGSGTGNSDGSIVHLLYGRSGSSFENCRFLGNSYAPWGGTATSGTLVLYMNASSADVKIDKCTFAYNLHGVCAGITVFQGKATVRNSIFHANLVNATAAKAADIYCAASTATVDVDYSLFHENSSTYLNSGSGTLTIGDNNVYGDPLLATDYDTVKTHLAGTLNTYPTATHPFYYRPVDAYTTTLDFESIDVHLKSGAGRWTPSGYVTTDTGILSPAIDAGDPESDYSLEPVPNGSRLNLGCYANTLQASKSSSAIPEIKTASVTITDDYTRPKLTGELKSCDLPYSADVTVFYGYEQGEDDGSSGWTWSESVATALVPASAFEKTFCRYLEAGKTLYWRVIAYKAGEMTDSFGGSVVVAGDLPPFWGKGLGEDYIHVWAGGQGSNGGTNWLDACTSIDKAISLVTSTRTNIVIAGTVNSLAAEPFFTLPVTVSGGFDASMTSFEQRDPVAYPSVIDGAKTYNCIYFSNASGCSCLRDLTVTRSLMSAVKMTGAGDLRIVNCRLTNCGYYSTGPNRGRALYVAAPTTSTISITNCTFDGNITYNSGDTYECSGTAIYGTSSKRIFIDDTLFATNGFAWRSARSKVPGRDNTLGWVIYASCCPLTMRNCKFIGNRATGNGDRQGQIIQLQSMTTSQPCAFTNCLFAGNQLYPNGDGSMGCGMIRVQQSNAATLLDIYACTFVYNLYLEASSPVFLLEAGKVRVRNSIIAENMLGSLKGSANIAYFYSASATLDLDWCLVGPTTENTLPDVAPASMVGQATIGSNVIRDQYALFGTKESDFLAMLLGGSTPFTSFFHTITVYQTGCTYERAVFPQSFDTLSLNLHLAGGRYLDEETGLTRLIHRDTKSPAIDAGDPESDYTREPKPNGRRIDLGAYGNTPYTTARTPGAMIILR